MPKGKDLSSTMNAAVRMTAESLTNEELNDLYVVALHGANPFWIEGYAKARALFTEEDRRMPAVTLEALERVWQERIGNKYMHMNEAARMTAENLTDNELNDLYVVALWDADPLWIEGYAKARALFTEKGRRMPAVTLEALERVWQERIGNKFSEE